jgi:hypothetical protein
LRFAQKEAIVSPLSVLVPLPSLRISIFSFGRQEKILPRSEASDPAARSAYPVNFQLDLKFSRLTAVFFYHAYQATPSYHAFQLLIQRLFL